MTDWLQTYVSALPAIWMMDTGRYLVAASLMTIILRAVLARRAGRAQAAGPPRHRPRHTPGDPGVAALGG